LIVFLSSVDSSVKARFTPSAVLEVEVLWAPDDPYGCRLAGCEVGSLGS